MNGNVNVNGNGNGNGNANAYVITYGLPLLWVTQKGSLDSLGF